MENTPGQHPTPFSFPAGLIPPIHEDENSGTGKWHVSKCTELMCMCIVHSNVTKLTKAQEQAWYNVLFTTTDGVRKLMDQLHLSKVWLENVHFIPFRTWILWHDIFTACRCASGCRDWHFCITPLEGAVAVAAPHIWYPGQHCVRFHQFSYRYLYRFLSRQEEDFEELGLPKGPRIKLLVRHELTTVLL